jgi:Fur family ferric uptake transcriptional regulator
VEDPRVEEAVAALRAAGHRITAARRAVLRAIAESDGDPTAEEILERIVAIHPDVHIATVYRNLEALRDLGLVHHAHLRHGPAVYRLAGDEKEQLVCERCGSVTEVPGAALDKSRQDLRRRYGFRLGPQHFAITGRCRNCE